MNMKTQTGLLVALLVIVAATGGFLVGRESEPDATHRMPNGEHMMDASMGMHDEMGSMMANLSGKEGDELDKAFLTDMVVHHQGAVEMAKAVLASGKHPELKQMAEAIIAAQTKEIAQMQAWQKSWYGK